MNKPFQTYKSAPKKLVPGKLYMCKVHGNIPGQNAYLTMCVSWEKEGHLFYRATILNIADKMEKASVRHFPIWNMASEIDMFREVITK